MKEEKRRICDARSTHKHNTQTRKMMIIIALMKWAKKKKIKWITRQLFIHTSNNNNNNNIQIAFIKTIHELCCWKIFVFCCFFLFFISFVHLGERRATTIKIFICIAWTCAFDTWIFVWSSVCVECSLLISVGQMYEMLKKKAHISSKFQPINSFWSY